MISSQRLTQLRRPQVLVENRVSFGATDSELSIYDTYFPAEKVGLKANELLYCGMISGRKIMHSGQRKLGEHFLPHESFVIAPGEAVDIDFPGASDSRPTTCMTVEISKERVQQIADRMNQHLGNADGLGEWRYLPEYLHVHHASATQSLLEHLVHVYAENHPDRTLMVELGVTELVMRMLRHQGREFILQHCAELPDNNGMAAVIDAIQQQLNKPLDIDSLCLLGCMSRSRLYSEFNRQLGCSPGEMQHQLRMKEAARRLASCEPITTICYDLGYTNPSHFSRRFKRSFGCSPSEFRQRILCG